MATNTLITDFDNTLYDWFEVWHQSFSAMLGEIVRISGIDEQILVREIRAIHQKHRTSEYAFLIEELPCLQNAYPGQDLLQIFDDAIHAYRSARKASLKLYEGVMETLNNLRSSGILIVVYTESLAFYTNFRIRRLNLDSLVDFIYSPPDHDLPQSVANRASSQNDGTRLLHAQHRFLPAGVVKPNPEVLLDIIKEIGRNPSDCLYLGDSLMKDVAMAQAAGVVDVLAEYGVVQHHPGYSLLQKVSHWPEADVQRETATTKKTISPNHVIQKFSEVRQFF